MQRKIHFEDYPGLQFERLVFAYLARTRGWKSLNWLGEVGGESGRDIWGEMYRENDDSGRSQHITVCVQCKNFSSAITFSTIEKELTKLATLQCQPKQYWLYGGKMSAVTREKIQEHAKKHNGIDYVDFVSAAEFEEFLWRDCPSLATRFLSADLLPDDPEELKTIGEPAEARSTSEMLARLRPVFERNIFRVRTRDEGSIYDAIAATEGVQRALRTGVWATREGHFLGLVPRIDQFSDLTSRSQLEHLDRLLTDMHVLLIGIRDGRPLPSLQFAISTPSVTESNERACYEALIDGVKKEVDTALARLYSNWVVKRRHRT